MWSSTPSNYVLSQGFVIDLITSVLKLLLDSVKVGRVVRWKIELEAIKGKLESLRTFSMLTEGRWTYRELDRAKFLAKEAANYSSALFISKDEDMAYQMTFGLSDLQLKIDQLYTSGIDEITFEVLQSLRKKVLGLLTAALPDIVKDKSRILLQEHVFESFLKDPPNLVNETQILGDLLKHNKVICSKAELLVNLLYDREMRQETTKLNFVLVDLLEEIQFFKVKITEIFNKVPKLPFPKPPSIDELGFLDCFLENLTELLNHKSDSVTCSSMGLKVESVVQDFRSFRSLLTRITKQHTKKEDLKHLWTQTINVASNVEYIFDSLLVGNGPIWYLVLWFDEVKKEIEVLKTKVNKICDKIPDSEIHFGATNSYLASLEATSSEMNDVSVGFEDEEKSLVEHLLGESEKLQAVAIVGMAGLGKTHLANRIYNNNIVKDHFDVRMWCYVSQEYNRKHLLTSK